MSNPTFRKYVPFDAILLIQKSGLADTNFVGIDITKRLKSLGIDVNDILLMSDALNVFQQKNKYDDNFHVDIDYSAELTGLAIDRWIKVVETTRDKVSFEILGGSKDELAKSLLFINKDDFTAGNTEAYIYSTKLVAQDQKPDYYVKNENGTLSVYVKVDDDMPADEAHFLISNIYADEAGEYKLFGSQTNDTNLTIMNKSNILESADITALETRISQVEQDIIRIENDLQQIEQNKQDITSLQTDNTSNKNSIASLKNQQNTNTANIQSNTVNIAAEEQRITDLESETIRQDGSTDFIDGFVPVRDYSPATKKLVDDLEATLRNDFSTLSGYETEWEGSQTFTLDPNNADEYILDTTILNPQLGTAFDYTNNKKITVTLKLTNKEETENTRIGNEDKWDDLIREDTSRNTVLIIQGKIDTNGIFRIRGIDETQGAVAPLEEIPSLVAIYQITGNVYSSQGVTMDDERVTELESVVI